MQLLGTLIGASADAAQHEAARFCGFDTNAMVNERSLTEITFAALLGLEPNEQDLFVFQTLIGLLLTNGPGAISAQGAKGAVSADGPESPERVQLNKALIGFLTHTGYTHGGNGYEGIAFLNEQFRESRLEDPGRREHGIDLKALAARAVQRYAEYKAQRKNTGSLDIAKIPGVNHPVFKDKPVNHDPREVFIAELFARRGDYNVFHEFYRVLVQTAVRRRRLAQRLLREHRRRHRCAAAEDAVGTAAARPIQRARSGDGRIHDLPVSAHAGLRRRDRRPHEPRPQHGHAHASVAVPVRGVATRKHRQ